MRCGAAAVWSGHPAVCRAVLGSIGFLAQPLAGGCLVARGGSLNACVFALLQCVSWVQLCYVIGRAQVFLVSVLAGQLIDRHRSILHNGLIQHKLAFLVLMVLAQMPLVMCPPPFRAAR